MWFLIATVAIGVIALVGCIVRPERDNILGPIYGACSVFSLILVVVVSCTYMTSICDYAEVSAFLESGLYEQYPQVLQSQIDAGVIGDISNIETGKMLIYNLQQWYEKIEETNKTIFKYRLWNSLFFSDSFVYDWPEYPPLIDGQKIRDLQIAITKKVENMDAVPIISVGR